MDDYTAPTPEEVFSLTLYDKKKDVKVQVQLKDKEGNVIPIHTAVESLLDYIKKEVSKEDTVIVSQIFPLISQILISGLGRTVGIEGCAYFIMNDLTKECFIHMMALSFLFLKFIQQKNLQIVSVTEPISDAEKTLIAQKTMALGKKVSLSQFVGIPPSDILRELVRSGELDAEGIKEILKEKKDDQSSKGNNLN